ncbi:MAG: DUF1049 domain-containing protein [Pararhodobacter sp.]|nr:DUF1049 domain-containing protein [Pararhodobacter sp.]
MTVIRYVFLAIILVIAVTLALANNAPVTLAAWPDTISAFVGFNFTLTLPLFVVVGSAAVLGLLLGLVWEWLRERSYRAEAARLRREVEGLRVAPQAAGQPAAAASMPARPVARRDDVLEILEDSPARR